MIARDAAPLPSHVVSSTPRPGGGRGYVYICGRLEERSWSSDFARVGRAPDRLQMQLLLGLVCGLLLALRQSEAASISLGLPGLSTVTAQANRNPVLGAIRNITCANNWNYNNTYPLTKPVTEGDNVKYRIAIIADMDKLSRSREDPHTWVSTYLQGTLTWNPVSRNLSVEFDKEHSQTLKSKFNHGGRGMELSELVTFDGKLLTFDDRSGLIFVIEGSKIYPWVILVNGNGKTNKGFKAEWATVKDEHLYVGNFGKEWTSPTGEFENYDPMFVKRVSPNGVVESLDWVEKYKALRRKVDIEFPGYMTHESGVWSDVHKKWFFLPRKMSKDKYDDTEDERKGTNVLLSADDDFKNIDVQTIGDVEPTHGFSTFKFIPGTNDEVIVALKSVELEGKQESYILAFDIHGKILLEETKIEDTKYEGLEFI